MNNICTQELLPVCCKCLKFAKLIFVHIISCSRVLTQSALDDILDCLFCTLQMHVLTDWFNHQQTWSPVQRPDCLAAASTRVTKTPPTPHLSWPVNVTSNGGQTLLPCWRCNVTCRVWEFAEHASRSSSSWPSKPWTVRSTTKHRNFIQTHCYWQHHRQQHAPSICGEKIRKWPIFLY